MELSTLSPVASMMFANRLKLVIEHQRLKVSEFSNSLGYERPQSVYDFVNGKVKPSFDFFEKFISAGYSSIIDLEWLITGDGEMLGRKKEHNRQIEQENYDLKIKIEVLVGVIQKFIEAKVSQEINSKF